GEVTAVGREASLMSALPRELAVQQAAEDDRQDALRILCLNYEYPPMGGGAGNATHHTAVALAARGHLVHVLTARLPEQPAVESVQRVVVHRVRSFRRGMLDCGLFGAVSYLLFAF